MASKTNKSAAPKTSVAEPHKKEVQKYPTSKLLKSKHLAGYQRDFARVILTEPEYSVEEARAALDAVLGRGNAGHGKNSCKDFWLWYNETIRYERGCRRACSGKNRSGNISMHYE